MNSSEIHNKYLPSIYDAIVGYHNTLVQVRFTIAGLYLAATGFLVNSWFSKDPQKSSYFFLIPALGISLAISCWILEIRTYHLLSNLTERGNLIEHRMHLNYIGFFKLMNNQPILARLPFFSHGKHGKIPETEFTKYIISHSFGFNLIYLAILLFWIGTLFNWSAIIFCIATLLNRWFFLVTK